MAIFKAPRITTAQRLPLVLQQSEIVYDLDTKSFWGGNGITLGGFPLGAGFAEGAFEAITLTQLDIDNKSVELSRMPLGQDFILVEVIGGPIQLYDIDYTTIGMTLTWDSLGLDGVLEAGDILIVTYMPFVGGVTGGALQIIQLTLNDINNGYVTLSSIPTTPENVKLDIVGGISQLYNVDYVVGGNILSWNGLGLDGFLQVDDILIIQI